MMELLKPYWDLLNQPVLWLFSQLGIIPSRVLLTGGKVVLLVAALLVISTIVGRLARSRAPKSGRARARMARQKASGAVSLRALKRERNYLGLGDYYASHGKTAAAIDYYNKAGAHEKEAEQYLQLGEPVMAAELFSESGDHQRAAEISQNSGEWALAASYHEEGRNFRGAAEAWLHADDFAAAGKCFSRLLNDGDSDDNLLQSASSLLDRLRGSAHADSRKNLSLALVGAMDAEQSPQRAGELYKEAGELIKAGEYFTKAGQLDAARECFHNAGDDSRVTHMRAAQHESSGDYAIAAKEYEENAELEKAADCYLQAGSHADAARCFEAADLAFRAAREYSNIGHWDHTNRVLQAISSEHPDFERSRGLLSSSFYELGNFQACVSSFKNELEHARVEPKNINDFYYMALALEEIGELEEAREVLYKVNAVNTHFKDNEQHLAAISERLVQRHAPATQAAPAAPAAAATRQVAGDFVPDTLDDQTKAWEAATQVTEAGVQMFRSRYRIDCELGRGGMGVVYKAHDTLLDRPVALKFLGTVADDGRFEREARAAAKLIHSHIIAVFDFSGEQGESFIAMEYLDGQGLDGHIQAHGAMKPKMAVDLIVKICSALQAVHNLGIIHRDIKPANIVIGKAGEIKLLDFGLAKANYDTKLTATGMVMGTPSYMGPEQVLGKPADARTDLYSLGLVLFECLTGKTAFRSGNVLERQLTELPPKFSEYDITVSSKLEAVNFKAIAKDPDERFQSADEFAVALQLAMKQ